MIREIDERLLLVGVAHVLPKSIEEVKETIEDKNPDTVAVELCHNRFLQLTSPEKGENKGMGDFSQETLLAKLLSYFQEKIGQKTGMMPGEEMITAIQKAQENGAEVKLIDRDINTTLNRLIQRTSSWEKIRVVLELFFSFLWSREEIDLEKFTEEKYLEELISTFRDFSEPAYEVLIEERNMYMADKISDLLKSRSGKIVCVVGAGHVPGLTEILNSRFKEGVPEPWHSMTMSWRTQ